LTSSTSTNEAVLGGSVDRLTDGNLEMRDAARDLVEGGKHGNRVLDRIRLGKVSGQRQGRGGDSRA
jgi:hypothetical protein